MAFLLAFGTVPIYAADTSPMEITFVNAPNGAEMASETATLPIAIPRTNDPNFIAYIDRSALEAIECALAVSDDE